MASYSEDAPRPEATLVLYRLGTFLSSRPLLPPNRAVPPLCVPIFCPPPIPAPPHPVHHYWQWVSHARHVMLRITAAPTPEPRIQVRMDGVALFKYPCGCLAQKCPGHPKKSPICMALHASVALP